MYTNQQKEKKKAQEKINIVSLGCSKNRVDSEVLYSQLTYEGLPVVHEEEHSDARVVVINTCGFIDHAKEESVNTILAYAAEKEAGNIDQLYVMGCLSERYKESLQSEIPEVDKYFGTQHIPEIVETLGGKYKYELLGERLITTDAHYAYLKIAEGCNRPCSFCAIPLMRGKHRSRSIEGLVEEATFLVSRGVRELMLIAQDLTFYGLDLYGKRKLNDLLKALSDVDGLEWIRLHYAYPSGFPVEILPTINERGNICNYLDMPLQHISNNMLKIMRRGLTKEKTMDLINTIRDKVPEIALRTTLLVGHPGENEKDQEELLEFVDNVKFERLGVFTYSHEEQTHAGNNYEDEVDQRIKQRRHDEVLELQQDISLSLNQQRIGNVLRVIIDRREDSYYIGRTEWDSPEVDNEVIVSGEQLEYGRFYQVKITDALEYDLMGHVIPLQE